MKSPIVLFRVSLGVAAAGAVFSPTASACLQGYHRPKDQKVQPLEPVPPLKSDVAQFKLEMPTIEPLKIAGLLGKSDAPPATATAAELREAAWRLEVVDYERRPKGTASFEETTNYAVALIFLNRPVEAIKVLVELEAQRPGVYTTAANLGTAYELTGQLEAALRWISAGIERNAGSHGGTEWLHVAILRAKINLRADAAWLAKHSVLDGADVRDAGEIAARLKS